MKTQTPKASAASAKATAAKAARAAASAKAFAAKAAKAGEAIGKASAAAVEHVRKAGLSALETFATAVAKALKTAGIETVSEALWNDSLAPSCKAGYAAAKGSAPSGPRLSEMKTITLCVSRGIPLRGDDKDERLTNARLDLAASGVKRRGGGAASGATAKGAGKTSGKGKAARKAAQAARKLAPTVPGSKASPVTIHPAMTADAALAFAFPKDAGFRADLLALYVDGGVHWRGIVGAVKKAALNLDAERRARDDAERAMAKAT